MSVRAREPAAEGVATTAARLETVLRVGHDFQERPDPTAVPPSIVKNRSRFYSGNSEATPGGSDVQDELAKVVLPPPPPAPPPDALSVWNPKMAASLEDIAVENGVAIEEVSEIATTLLTCVEAEDYDFLEDLLSAVELKDVGEDEFGELERTAAALAKSKDADGILGDAPTLIESIYFFADTLTLLAIRRLEDPCAVESVVQSLPEEIRTKVLDRAARLWMLASLLYPQDDPIKSWKRTQSVFFASIALPSAPDASVALLNVQDTTAAFPDETPTSGAAADRLIETAQKNKFKLAFLYYVFLLSGQMEGTEPLRVAERVEVFRIALRGATCYRGTDLCNLDEFEFAKLLARPSYELDWWTTLRAPLVPWGLSAPIPYDELNREPEWWKLRLSRWKYENPGKLPTYHEDTLAKKMEENGRRYAVMRTFGNIVLPPSIVILVGLYLFSREDEAAGQRSARRRRRR